jgi:hypothetical protein
MVETYNATILGNTSKRKKRGQSGFDFVFPNPKRKRNKVDNPPFENS